MCRYRHILLVILLLLSSCRAYTQGRSDYVVTVRHLSTDNGMLTDAISCGLQDKLGFIWLGTPDGLQRYDGSQFKLLTREKDGLQANHINHLALAANGMVWISYGTAENKAGGMVDILDPATGKSSSFRQAFGRNAPVDERQVFLVISNELGDIFIITLGSDVWMYRNGRFRKIYDHPAPLLLTRSTWHHKAKGGQLWLCAADMGSISVDTAGHWAHIPYSSGTAIQPVAVYKDGRALLWVTYEVAGAYPVRSRFLLAGPDGKMTTSSFDPYANIASSYGNYYLCALSDVQTGCLAYQTRNPEISLLLPGTNMPIRIIDSATVASLNNALLGNIFSDAAGRYWICTAKGLFVADVRPNGFSHYLDKATLKATVSQMRGICQTMEGRTWAAGWDGIYQFSNDDGAVISRVPGRNPTVIYRDGMHTWAATRDSLVDLTGGNHSIILPGRLGFENEIWALHRDGEKLYAGTIHGIWDIYGPPAAWLRLSGEGSGTDGWCYGFFRSRDGDLWATTTTGLLRLKNGHIADRYAEDAADTAHHIPCTDIHYLYEDASGDFWLCTNGGGLLHWQRRAGRFARYTVAEGLSSNTLYALLADGQGYYWISSNRGLMRFDPRTAAVKTYTVKDGLKDDEFNRISVYKASDGRMYFGGINGLISFDPARLNAAQGGAAYHAPMRVSSLYHFNAGSNQLEDKTAGLLQTNLISISPEDGFYTLNFQLLDFESQQHPYAYQIEGLETQWNYITEGSLRLGNLPYGRYTLRVKGQQASGWSANQLVITLVVLRPFYRTVWFLLAVTLAAISLVWFGIRWRERRLRQANERLERTVSQRTGQLAQMLSEKDLLMKEIHHRVKNNLQVISALQQMQASRSSDPAVKAALADSQNRVLSIAFIHQNLYQHEELKGVEMRSFVQELSAHVMAVCKGDEMDIEVGQDISAITLDIDTAVPVGLMLNELLTNSCKHAFNHRRNGHIIIRLWQQYPGTYRLEYEDDGPGMKHVSDTGKTNSLGMKLINQLAEQLDGVLQYLPPPVNRITLDFKDFETRNKD